MGRFAAYTWIAQPDIAAGAPLPAIVTRPSMKSVGASGMGNGLQRIWFGDGAMPSKPAAMRPLPIGSNGPCMAAGRMRYSHERRLWLRGAVNAVPDNCSAYRP